MYFINVFVKKKEKKEKKEKEKKEKKIITSRRARRKILNVLKGKRNINRFRKYDKRKFIVPLNYKEPIIPMPLPSAPPMFNFNENNKPSAPPMSDFENNNKPSAPVNYNQNEFPE